MATTRQIDILKLLRSFPYMRTSQIRDAIIPSDKDGCTTRENLRDLSKKGFTRRYQPKLIDDETNSAPPIHVLTVNGSCELASVLNDASFLLREERSFRDWMGLNHACGLTSLHLKLDAAFASQNHVTQHALFFEQEVSDPHAKDPCDRFKLQERINVGRPLLFCPDSAFETELNGKRRAWYVEFQTGADGSPSRVAAKKSPAVAALGDTYKRHFPLATSFRMIAFCLNMGWRESLRREMRDKPGAEYWLFCSITDLKENLLHAPIFFKAAGDPVPLIPPPASPGRGLRAVGESGVKQLTEVEI